MAFWRKTSKKKGKTGSTIDDLVGGKFAGGPSNAWSPYGRREELVQEPVADLETGAKQVAERESEVDLGQRHGDEDADPARSVGEGGQSAKRTKFSNRQKPSELMSAFGKTAKQSKCTKCQAVEDGRSSLYRCFHCQSPVVLCKSCVLNVHEANPWHFVEEWDKLRRFWKRMPLTRLGVTIHLGHNGHACPLSLAEPRTMTIVSENGMHEMGMQFCRCLDPVTQEYTPDVTQLLLRGYWPSTWDKPLTAFTVQVMKEFTLLANQADSVTDRYHEFLSAHRTFSFVTAAKRHGRDIRNLAYSDLTVLCPACPQVDMNMDPGWLSRREELRFLDALYYSIDGNFHANLKEKPGDENDFPLSKGAGYFANEDAVAAYLQTQASGLQRWIDLLVHVAAYDISCQYQIKFNWRMEELARTLERLEISHLVKMNRKRLFPKTIAGVGKFHLAGHRADCRYLRSFNFLPFSTMADGEASERVWSVANPNGNRSREMNPGHRHDEITRFYGDQNARRVHNMPITLDRKHRIGEEHHGKVATALQFLEDEIEDKFGEEWLEELKQTETRFKEDVLDPKKHPNLKNPYDLERPDVPSQQQVVVRLQTQHAALKGGLEGIAVIEDGITLQERKAALLHLIENGESVRSIANERGDLQLEVATWQERYAALESVETEGEDEDEEENEEIIDRRSGKRKASGHGGERKERSAEWHEVNAMAIILPSSCDRRLLDDESMKGVKDVETELRKGQGHHALDLLRTHLITSYSTQEEAKQRSSRAKKGHAATTRFGSRIANKKRDIRTAADLYRRVRRALVALGVTNDQDFKPLRQSDCKPFTVSTADQLGDSKKQPSWIWQRLKFLDNDDVTKNFDNYAEAAIKVHWFRMSALKSRWWEEVEVVQEEMRRTVRFFKFSEDEWLQRGEREEEAGFEGGASYARKQAYRYERLVEVCRETWRKVEGVNIDKIFHHRPDGGRYSLDTTAEVRRYIRDLDPVD
ncbi:hypothetical protein PHLGIDRAFT_113846 [Phlebiopsis gigantea 11061_1 CR5-6]|uniref:CxC2-like cysteine cluster KDZ transposase-associated domain-containing protein n=1 Tax=Phlebiopsis gigantea (strain 11061_1 CR5-6) TaxID=745531 RepID=A0A0C3P385_PHLG1|nr:hypothetical protein PHLGIDRAFT_113846 [Phlebiopsis gigantea 11061_1 CR5-6]